MLICANAGNEFIVGAFGALKNDENAEDHGALKRLGFLVYNNATGEISNKGWPPCWQRRV
jgi:hypothetical protein